MHHAITRVRHELKRRRLTVTRVEDVTPKMRRVHLTGPELAGFTSLGPDDHVKLLIPTASGEERRDYTPRRYDAATNTLVIDFALHEAGPATAWALAAEPGAEIEIGGPRGSLVVPADFDWWLLVGDETALPAIARRLEELPPGTAVVSVVAVTGADEEQPLTSSACLRPIWVHRPAERADDPAPLLAALEVLDLPSTDGFVFIAAEATVARAARDWAIRRGHPPGFMRAAGYWKKGLADAHEAMEG